MASADTGDVGKTNKLGRLRADDAVEHPVLLVDQNGIAKTQTSDSGGDLTNMKPVDLAHVTRRDSKIFRRELDKLKLRHEIIANGVRHGRDVCSGLLDLAPSFRFEGACFTMTTSQVFAFLKHAAKKIWKFG